MEISQTNNNNIQEHRFIQKKPAKLATKHEDDKQIECGRMNIICTTKYYVWNRQEKVSERCTRSIRITRVRESMRSSYGNTT